MHRLSMIVLLLSVPFAAHLAADRTEGRMFATRSVVHARHGMVAASHPLAVQIGIDILKQGGSAVDAAIAVNAALGFLEPVANGVGGLQILDVSSASAPSLGARLADFGGYSRRVFVRGDHAFVSAQDAGLAIVDVSDPEDPTLASTFSID